jgi:hypothetical protein
MPLYTCDNCSKSFKQKAHFEVHKNRTNPCKKQTSIEELVEQKVQEVLLKTNALTKIETQPATPSCSPTMPTNAKDMKHKKDLGQYFTIAEELQTFVFEKVKHKSSPLLEPSFGAGHLLKKFKEYNDKYPMTCYDRV